ncbi:hypothetical protein EMCRGX_G014819 [Ephydatia muelleri]
MTQYEPKPAKKIYIYRNGDVNAEPKLLVVNDRQVRDFATFLGRVTSSIKAPVAVRTIYTPNGGQRIQNIGDLKTGSYYVASGGEQFKKISYQYQRRLLPRRPANELGTPATKFQRAVAASARYKKPVEKPLVIHVFRNGDERFRGARVLLPRIIMNQWEMVLETITEKLELYTPAKRLCTLDGKIVHSVGELQDGGRYVALEGSKSFKKAAYSSTEETPLHRRRLHTLLKQSSERAKLQSLSQPHDFLPHPPPDSVASLPRRRIKLRPMAGRKNKEAREMAVRNIREDDSIFGDTSKHNETVNSLAEQDTSYRSASPVSPATTLSQRGEGRGEDIETLQSEDEMAAVLRTSETNEVEQIMQSEIKRGIDLVTHTIHEQDDIETVQESGDVEIERPIDQEEAEEVGEEGAATLSSPQPQATTHHGQDLELVARPQQTHIDLSVNRMVSGGHTKLESTLPQLEGEASKSTISKFHRKQAL